MWSVGTGRLGGRGMATPPASPGMPAPFVPTSADPQVAPTVPVSPASIPAPTVKTDCPLEMRLAGAVCFDPLAQEVAADAKKGISFVEAARFCGARGGRLCREAEWAQVCAGQKWPQPARGEWTVDASESPVVRGGRNCSGRIVPTSLGGSPTVTFRCCADPH